MSIPNELCRQYPAVFGSPDGLITCSFFMIASFSSSLSNNAWRRWRLLSESLLPFDFTLDAVPGRTSGFRRR
eukprot:5575816-Pyramimonas_sp.AAC.1